MRSETRSAGPGANDGNFVDWQRSNGILSNEQRRQRGPGNSVYGNTGLGIDLAEDGVTANDAGDGDTGDNDLLNYPVITSAVESGGSVTVTFDLDVPAGTYRVEFFDNSAADGSGLARARRSLAAST